MYTVPLHRDGAQAGGDHKLSHHCWNPLLLQHSPRKLFYIFKVFNPHLRGLKKRYLYAAQFKVECFIYLSLVALRLMRPRYGH